MQGVFLKDECRANMMKKPDGQDRNRFLHLMNDAHDGTGRNLREVEALCFVDHTYIYRILKGERHPNREVILRICLFGWNLDGYGTEDILRAGGYKTLLDWKEAGWED